MHQHSLQDIHRATGLAEHTFPLHATGGLLVVLSCLLLAGCASGPDTFLNPPRSESNAAFSRPDARELSKEQASNPDKNKVQGKKIDKETAQAMVQYNKTLTTGRETEKQGDLTSARETYERLIAQYPDRYEAYHRLAVVADRQRRYEEAQSLYTQAIRRNSRNPELFNDLGYCFYLQGKLNKAESALLKAVAMRPAEPRYRNNLGLVYGQQRRYEDALEQYRRAGGGGDAYYNLAFVKASQNDFEGAKDCFRRALAVDPTHERARLALASFETAENHPETLSNSGPLTDDGTLWVSYVENDANKADVAQSETSKTSASTEHAATIQRSATRGLIDKAQNRAMNDQTMSR